MNAKDPVGKKTEVTGTSRGAITQPYESEVFELGERVAIGGDRGKR